MTGVTDNLDIYGAAGADVLKGGAGKDIFVFTAANLTKTDTVSGGGGNNELLMTAPGTVDANGVSGVESYVLADGAANTLTLTSANFAESPARRSPSPTATTATRSAPRAWPLPIESSSMPATMCSPPAATPR